MRLQLFKDRYFAPGETNEAQVYARVAMAIGGIHPNGVMDATTRKVFQAMQSGVWLPNTPTIANAGRPGAGGLSACYVLPCEDSLDGIYKTIWDAAKVHKAFGGTGFNFSHLRPKGNTIHSTGGKACGPIKIMQLLDHSSGVVMQGGKREGANMGILNATHHDIEEFIHCKPTIRDIPHFNTSVGMTDADMHNEDLLTMIAIEAWKTGNPGLIFLDRLNEHNTLEGLPRMECTNPCGEQPLRRYESCNLGSINLSKFPQVADGDCKEFMDCIDLSVTSLDRIIDINAFPIPEIKEATLLTRKVGSGLMGWADWLILNSISYQSNVALQWIDKLGEMYQMCAENTSHNLALEWGAYPAYAGEENASVRNETRITLAPTGTLSYLAGCSWGIEPVFDWDYQRTSEAGSQQMKSNVYQAAKDSGLLEDTAHKISWEWQIRHVAGWQKWVDNGVSKTINLPNTATIEEVIRAFKLAWQLKCKGITVYRDGSREEQAITKGVAPTKVQGPQEDSIKVDQHGVERFGSTLDLQSGCGRIHVTCNDTTRDSNRPYEVYILSDGGCPASNEAIGKLISKYVHDPRLLGRELDTIKRITKTLKKVDCPTALRNPKAQGKSCADIIAKRMEAVWIQPPTAKASVQASSEEMRVCPQCGEPSLDFGAGCRSGSCRGCGWSGCM